MAPRLRPATKPVPGRGRGRPAGFVMSKEHRVKIQESNILNALIEHAEGKREMGSTQVTAGLGLLDRVLPKMSTHTVQGDEDGGPIIFQTIYEK